MEASEPPKKKTGLKDAWHFARMFLCLPKFFSGMLASEAEGGSFGMMLMSDETTIGTIAAAVFPRYISFISLLYRYLK